MAVFSITEAMVRWIASMGVRASTRPPASPGGAFATVERVGGGVSSLVDRASMAVQVWAPTEDEAELTANAIRLAMLTQAPPAGIHSIRVSAGPYPFYDDETRMPRYQMVVDAACQIETNSQA